jgi:hypothetical protein
MLGRASATVDNRVPATMVAASATAILTDSNLSTFLSCPFGAPNAGQAAPDTPVAGLTTHF